jgi:hypothetical protein
MVESISITSEGFRLSPDRFILPTDTSDFDAHDKRAVTICNLFVNHKMGIGDIVRLLDEDTERVILTLLSQKIILDRRYHNLEETHGKERRKSISRRAVGR